MSKFQIWYESVNNRDIFFKYIDTLLLFLCKNSRKIKIALKYMILKLYKLYFDARITHNKKVLYFNILKIFKYIFTMRNHNPYIKFIFVKYYF